MQVENECKITENFCIIDDFCKEFSKIESKNNCLANTQQPAISLKRKTGKPRSHITQNRLTRH